MENKDTRVGTWGSICIFGAYGLTCTVAQTGALAGQGAAFNVGFWGLLLGAIFWGIFSFGSAYIGHKTGVAKDVIWKTIFGRYGSKLPSVLVGIVLFFWGGFDTFIAAQAIGNLFPPEYYVVGFAITVVLVVFITSFAVVRGIPGIKWVSMISVPVAFILFVAIIIGAINASGGWAVVSQNVPETIVYDNVWDVAHMFVGCWMAGILSTCDFGSGVKNAKSLAAGTFSGGIITCFCFMVGFFGNIATGEASLGNICLALGGAIWICGCFFTFVAQANTQPGSALFYCNSISTAFNLKFAMVGIVMPILCGIESFWIGFGGDGVNTISAIMTAVGVIISPIYGTVLSEFYIVRKLKLEIAEDETTLPVVCPAGIISVIAGIIIATLISNVRFYVVLTVAAVALIHACLRLVIKMD